MTPLMTLWPFRVTDLLRAKTSYILDNRYHLAKDYVAQGDDATIASLGDAYRKLIKLTAVDTTLHIVAVIPLFEEGAVDTLRRILECCRESADRLTLHVVCLGASLAKVCGEERSESDSSTVKDQLARLRQLKSEEIFPWSMTLMEDYVLSGAPVLFSVDTLGRWLAMFFYALMKGNYYEVLPVALTGIENCNISAGISGVGFDMDAATDYLLHKAFVKALDKEDICAEKVDIQRATTMANEKLAGIGKRYEAFLEDTVMKKFRDMHETGDTADRLVSEITPSLEDEFSEVGSRIKGVLTDRSISFPEKEGVLAMVLGRDNERLRGMQYDVERPLLDDVAAYPIKLYVDAFNNYCSGSGLLPLRGDIPGLKKYVYDEDKKKIVESMSNLYSFYPMPEIKTLKKKILDTTSFIRRKSDELRNLEESNSERVLKEEGMSDKGIVRRYAGDAEIKEQPLDEDYVPPQGMKPLNSVDLRKFFSPVKDQGQIGSCSTFAVISMYEAMMNRFLPEGSEKANMSERFVYYYSNVLAGRPEGGSNYHDQLGVLGKYGTCQEALCSYSDPDITAAPTEEAIKNAEGHRVLKALQIPLANLPNKADSLKRNHQLLTSALSEGYPVGISLTLYEGFGKSQFVNRPSEGEISKGVAEYHAMVLVGYSETDKCYIVRNSWGTAFGDNGYCYISSAYIDDPALCNFACVIADTTDTRVEKGGEIPQMVAGFGATETQIRMAVIRNVLDEAMVQLEGMQDEFRDLFKYYQMLLNKLGMPLVRDEIRKESEKAASSWYGDVALEFNGLENTFVDKMREFKRKYIKEALITTGGALSMDIVAGTMMLNGVTGTWAYAYYCLAALGTLVSVFLWLHYRWAKRKKRRELQEQIEECAMKKEAAWRKWAETQLRFHIAGMWIDRYNDLTLEITRVYDRLVSYNDNLRRWHEEDSRNIVKALPESDQMFVRLENGALLDRYFNENQEQMIKRVDLMGAFSDYSIDQQSIQNVRERLQKETAEEIRKYFSSFRIIEHFLHPGRFSYVPEVDVEETTGSLLRSSQPTWRCTLPDLDQPMRVLLIDIDDTEKQRWHEMTDQYYPSPVPSLLNSADSSTILLVTLQPLPLV